MESDAHWQRTKLSFVWTLMLLAMAAITLASFL